ncbi:fungal pheromone STE3G-protein-coupled receptor [Panus rudis PR-1116 ss-1]|nr:fungal pheromone STE3G-protein-coupled receptor [Panus rudis PR-1116 ss-1]
MHPEFPYIAFISAVLVLLPVPWHFRAGNVATLSMIAWLFVVNIIYGVDAAVWGNTIKPTLTVWCDITTRILIGANIALPAACMSVCIHLEAVASVRQATTSRADKTRRQIREAILCFLVPMVWMGLHFIVQGHRYDIIEGFGCRPSTYVSLPAIFLLYFPALLMSVIASVFAATAIWHFIRRRIVFARHLENSNSGLNTSRYLRLIMMAISQLFISTAATTASLVFSVKFDYRPWTNWDDVHFNFSRIDRFPALLIPPYALHFYTALWWIIPISSVSFFIFFGFGQEAMREYSACWTWFRTRILRLSPKPSGSFLSSGGTGHFAVLSPKYVTGCPRFYFVIQC